ncbi:hypothetical protein RRG08_020038 [Elysia crispata]|uniref:Major facilitator superfamily (MFS) profile domain-containing protein n=1 Tax=Elysia crispata TaxID=231223 RepID=A0AAE1EDI2_9GAST|nr:hypothetical protein RRG08_020038 [Elysia crispata]
MTTIEQIFDEIGGLGKFQIYTLIFSASVKLMFAYSMLLMSYAGYISEFECVVQPKSARQSRSAVYTNRSSQLETGSGRVLNDSTLNVCRVNGTECHDFRFLGSKRTVISEWNLVCELRWLKAAIISIQMGGVTLGAIVGGFMGDYFGRKKTLYGSVFLHIVFNIMAAFSINWQMFAAMRFFIGIMIGSGMVIVIIYPTEFLPTRWRHVISVVPCWPMGVMALAWSAAWLEDWSHLHIATAALAAATFTGYLYMPESPRWLATQGRLAESHDALKKMARTNGKRLPQISTEVIKNISDDKKERDKDKNYTYLDLFKGRKNRKITLIFSFQWFVVAFVYYGLGFAVTSFAGNLYLNIFLMNVVQIPSYFITLFILGRIGRRMTCVIYMATMMLLSLMCLIFHLTATDHNRKMAISNVCMAASLVTVGCWSTSQAWVAESYPTVSRRGSLRVIRPSPGETAVGHWELSDRIQVRQVWVTESYPTVFRSLGYGFVSLASRLGGVVAPFLINLDEWAMSSFILMSVTTLVSMLAILFIPETAKLAMEETMNGHIPNSDPSKNDLSYDVISTAPGKRDESGPDLAVSVA